MKVHVFKVDEAKNSAPLEDLLKQIKKTPLKKRTRILSGGVEVRIESIKKNKKGLWFMDFVRFRFTHGPGCAHRAKKIEGFSFDDESGFGEETAALYVPSKGYLIVQYNQNGTRSGKIGDYLSSYDNSNANAYELNPKYDSKTEARLNKKKMFRRLEFSVAPGKISSDLRQTKTSLTKALDISGNTGADLVTVTLGVEAGNKSGLDFKSVRNGINWLKKELGSDEDSVKKIKVSGKESQDDLLEVIDLIQQRLSINFSDLPVGKDLRWPRDDRWKALQRAYNGWKKELK